MTNIIEVKESGYVKKNGYLHIENYEFDKNGNIYAIGEFFDSGVGFSGSLIVPLSKTFNIKCKVS